ncbi:hypothetical protein ABZ917_21930 [Nonomuraea wenchangensis]
MTDALNGKGLALIPRTDTKQTLKDFKARRSGPCHQPQSSRE